MNGVSDKEKQILEEGYQSRDDIQLHSLSPDGSKDTTCEEASLVERRHRVSIRTAVQLRLAVLIVSWLSVVLLGVLGIGTFILRYFVAVFEHSSASFAFALDAILDCMSSLVVIWRFSGTANTLYSVKRESMACIILGILFLISAVSIVIKSTLALVHQVHSTHGNAMWYLFLINGLICLILVTSKVFLGYKLESSALISDALNSGIGAVLAFTSLGTNLSNSKRSHDWMADPIVGIICATVIWIYGMWIVIYSSKNLKNGHENNGHEHPEMTN